MGITPVLHVNPDDFAQEELASAGRILREGGLVVFPTETVYGLGANALDETAARAIYTAKGRPSDNPLIVHLPDLSQLDLLCRDIPPAGIRPVCRFFSRASDRHFEQTAAGARRGVGAGLTPLPSASPPTPLQPRCCARPPSRWPPPPPTARAVQAPHGLPMSSKTWTGGSTS